MGRHTIQAEDRRDEHAISIIIPHIFISHFQRPLKEIRAGFIIAMTWVYGPIYESSLSCGFEEAFIPRCGI